MVGSTRARRQLRDRALALLATAVLGVGALSMPTHGAAPTGPKPRAAGKYNGKAVRLDPSVAGAAWKSSTMKGPPAPAPLVLSATAFPAAASAEVAIAPRPAMTRATDSAAPPLVRAAGTPVVVGAPASHDSAPAATTTGSVGTDTPVAAPPAKVAVTVGDHSAAIAAGVTGVVVSVARSDGQTGPATVAVGIDYSTFAQAFGGDLPDRLQLVALPACVLTTPRVAACRTQTPVKFVNDRAGKKLTADLTLPGAATDPSALTTDGGSKTDQPAAASTSSPAKAPAKAPVMVLAATTAPSGSTGSYTATSLSASNSWGEGGNTGSFTYSYPIGLPPALGGAAPAVALRYDSGSVDGKTAVENAQPSWIGDGWDYSPGYIERSYAPCSKAQPTKFGTSGDNCFARDKNGNLLPALTMSFGSHGGQLVPTDGTNTSFKLPTDDGTQVDVLFGQTANGTRTGEFYRVRSPDGTVSFLGANILPDASAITAAAGSTVSMSSGVVTGSAWTEPVFNDSAASGCQDPTKVTDPSTGGSNCMQAWRWNADFVIDPHNNVTRYSYLAETNYYGFGSAKKPVWYVRGGVLNEIDYGWQLSDVQTTSGINPHQSAARVWFKTATRCVDPANDGGYDVGSYGTGQSGCGGTAFDTVPSSNMVDTPVDQNCPVNGTANNQCQSPSPTFWSSRRLASIVTQVAVNGTYKNVDHWDLFNQFHTLDTANSPMWLAAIRRCAASVVGSNGVCPHAVNGAANQQSLPDVQFSPYKLAQRVPGVTGTNVPPNLPDYQRERIGGIFNELGASTAVTYDTPSSYAPLGCTAPPTVAPDWHNTQLCYPEYWTAPGTSGPFTDWFHKYVVTGIITQDNTHAPNVPAPTVATSYIYGSSSSSIYSAPNSNGAGVAWHSNDSELLTDPASRTYDQYRGFAVVTATVGSPTDAPGHPQTKTITTYLRGMDQDPDKAAAAAGSCTSGTLTVQNDCTPWNLTDDLSGWATRDDNALAGTVFETQSVDTVTGNVYSTTANVPWMSTPIAQHTRTSPLPTLRSFQLGTARTLTQSPLASGSKQLTETRYWHKQALGGAVVATDTLPPGIADGSAEVCTTTDYALADASKPWMIGYSNQDKTTAAPCAYPDPIYAGDPPAARATGPVLTATRDYFDGGTSFPTTVLHGDITETDAQTGTRTVPGAFQPRSTAFFDVYGRALWTADAAGTRTSTSYAPANPGLASMELPTDTTVTGPDPTTGVGAWVSKTHFDSTRALPLASTDFNGRVTYIAYDALGRTTAVWLPGRAYNPVSPPPANSKFSYILNGYTGGTGTIAPSLTETDVLREDGTYAVSTALVDSLGRTRQTQSPPTSDDKGRIVTDTTYDSAGRVTAVSGPYYDSGSAPSGSFWVAASQSAIPRQTQTLYDGLGRTTDVVNVASGNELWRAHTAYPGVDRTDVTPPSGGVRVSTLTNVRGKTTAQYTLHAGAAFGATDPNSADALTYTYDEVGNLTEVDQLADSTGHTFNTWTSSYDLLGRLTDSSDPDVGRSTYTYDVNGGTQSVTSAVGTADQKSLYYTYDLLGRRTAEYKGTSTAGPKQASWSYDTVPALTAAQLQANPGSDTLGNLARPAGSIRYSESGAKYTESVSSYDATGHALSASVGIPNADGNGALGGKTYTTVNHYTALGQLSSTDLPTGGDLQADTVGYGYNVNGLLVGTSDMYADLLMDSAYSPFGEIQRRVLGDYPSQVIQDTVYDVPTRRVSNSTVSQLAWNAPIDSTSYTYNPAGQITATVDVQAKAASLNSTTGIVQTALSTDSQCFHYDYAGRLDAAWTDTGTVNGTAFGSVTFNPGATGGSGTANQAGAPTNGAIGGCVNYAPTAGVSGANWQIGGPQPYGQVFGYDGYAGNRKTETDYNVGGVVAGTNTYSYNAPGTAQPHVPQGVAHTVGTTTTNDSYRYDAAGNSIVRSVNGKPTQNLSWDAEGRLNNDNDTSGNAAAYVYDADGRQLLRRDGSTTTLYLGSTELHLTGTAVTGNRYFTYPGAPTIVETGTSTPKVSYEAGNLQGTAATTLAASPSTADKALTARRATTPFNTPRGIGQPTLFGTFPDDHTFLGKTTDATTGLVDMGARKYDPTIGQFISADPVLQVTSAQQIGGYSYAGNDPVNASDPSGLDPHTCAAGYHHDSSSGAMMCVKGDPPSTTSGAAMGVASKLTAKQKQKIKEHIQLAQELYPDSWNIPGTPGYQGLIEYLKHDIYGGPTWKDFWDAAKGPAAAMVVAAIGTALCPESAGLTCGVAVGAASGFAGQCATDCKDRTALVLSTIAGAATGAAFAKAGDLFDRMSGVCNSFLGATPVLMADGTSKSIDKVQVGDEIVNTQPDQKAVEHHKVTAVHVTDTDRDYTSVTVKAGKAPGTITSTSNHVFYVLTSHAWRPAGELSAGDELQTPDGGNAVVLSVHNFTQAARTYNLTVEGLHTYYVVAGDTPVLVHNAGGKGWCGGPIPNTGKPIVGDWPELGQTTLYTINDPATGQILKWGITDSPAARYDMSDYEYWNKQYGGKFQMSIIKNFDSEPDAWAVEYFMTSRHPGPENFEENAGKIPTSNTVGEDLQKALGLFPSGG